MKTIEKCTLSDKKLIEKAKELVSQLAKTGGKSWSLRVPVDFNNDPDMIFIALCKRLEDSQQQVSIAVEKACENEWIDVNERLPYENEEVNVYFETFIKRTQGDLMEKGVTSCIFSQHECLRPVFSKDNGWVVLGVKMWMPLPTPPKTDK